MKSFLELKRKNPPIYIVGGIMKKLFLFSFMSLVLLNGCQNKKEEIISKDSKEYEYDDVSHLMIEWNHIFDQVEEDYMTYFYSETCGHCKQIKQQVIDYALNGMNKIYFVKFTDEIPIITDRDSVIGKESTTELGIVGTPSIFVISSHIIVDYIVGSTAIISTLTN